MLQELSPEMSVFALLGSEGNVYFVCLFVCHTEHFKSVPCSDITTKHHRAHRSFLRGCDWGQVRPRPQIHVQKHTTFVCRTAVFQSPMKTSVDLLRRSIFPAAACSYRAPFLTNTVIHEIQRNVIPLFLSVFPWKAAKLTQSVPNKFLSSNLSLDLTAENRMSVRPTRGSPSVPGSDTHGRTASRYSGCVCASASKCVKKKP